MRTLHKTKKIWTESSIQKTLIERFMSESNIKYICENLFIFKGWESDLILITKSNYVYEFEIKISKNDFKNDFKNKRKKHLIGNDILVGQYHFLSQRFTGFATSSLHAIQPFPRLFFFLFL